MERLAEQLAIVTGHLQGFNSCNATLYENNFASLGLHADDEELSGYHYDEKFIVSFSLGAAREFLIRIKSEGQDISHNIQHGEILTMERLFQAECLHGVPVAPSVDSPRINLTFRNVVNHEP